MLHYWSFFFLIVLSVIVLGYGTIIKSEYEINENSYYYTLSTIPQVIATLVGLIAIFSVYIMEGVKKRSTSEIHVKTVKNFTYFFLITLLLLGSVLIIYSLYYLPLFGFVEQHLKILVFTIIGCTVMLFEIILFILYSQDMEEER